MDIGLAGRKHMSSLKVHTIQSVATSAALYPLIGENAIPFGLAVIFIDLDHVVEYVRITGNHDVRGVFPYCKLIEKNLDKKFLVYNMFHTVEFFAAVFAMSFFLPVLKYVFAGLVYHFVFDMVHLLRIRHPFGRVFSVFEYLYKTRHGNYITRLEEIVKAEKLDTSQVNGFDRWKEKWGLGSGAVSY